MVTSTVLKAMDSAKTSGYHFLAIVVAGMGFFTDAYDLFCISTVTKLLGRIYYYNPTTGKPGVLPPNVSAAVNAMALCGTLSGQLFFGWLGDKLGRKKVYGVTLMLMFIMSVASALSFGSTATSVITTLCFFRFWLGFGIGGDYPLSATIMSEYANTKTRGAFIAAVFAMQGVGILFAATVSILVSGTMMDAYPAPPFNQDQIGSSRVEADMVWRIILGVGAIPAIITYYWRMQMPETARYTALVEGNVTQAAMDMTTILDMDFGDDDDLESSTSMESYGLFSSRFSQRHGLQLLGTASCWFLLDIAFYSQNLFQKDVFTAVGWLPPAKTMSAIQEVYRISRAQALIALCSTVPGYWVTVFTVDWLGRFIIQLQGFFFMTLFMAILAGKYHYFRGYNCTHGVADVKGSDYCEGHHVAFIILYALTFFFANFGPNTTTFIVPAELFPARLRSTCHGISAASGKLGAIIGAFGFLYLAESSSLTDVYQGTPDAGYPKGAGYQVALAILAATNGLGFCMTFLIPETKGKSLEELSGEAEAPADTMMAESGEKQPLDMDAVEMQA
eukprot:TRINITY_DN2915_c0_g1_i2.p1 TRINITY_DN2915_c0_g1~~TRINITY_DN2915_c0_g1_i2.p1  ORF type:complete len:561 (+),score=81.72 TRINITY_DN2915_c0_g1_i2:305-1987(+)